MRPAVLTTMILLLGCGAGDRSGQPAAGADGASGFEPPVATNAEIPIAYPPALYREGVEGTVVLRLFIDETGRIVPDSTVVAEGSGYPPLDSAALAGVAELQYAPARRNGVAVATTFLQPVQFQLPEDAAQGG